MDKIKRLNRKERERQQRRQAILDAATDALFEKGYYNATIAEIAAKAEFGVGTIYQFFPNKQALFGEILLKYFEDEIAKLRQNLNKLDCWREKLRAIMEYHLSMGVEESAEFLLMIRELFYTPVDELSRQRIDKFIAIQQSSLDMFHDVLCEARKDGYSLDPEFLSMAIMSTLNGIYDFKNMGLLKKSPVDYLDDIIKWITK